MPEVPTAVETLLERRARLGRPLVMGIINATADSFFAASRAQGEAALAAGLRMAEEGADLLDVGGESTRPGSDSVSGEEEASRVLPAVSALATRSGLLISIDTSKAAVALRALDAGACVLNDVLALRGPGMMEVAPRFSQVIMMHMKGESPKTMQADPRYTDCPAEVKSFLAARLAAFTAAGGVPARAWVDPGLGFGKTLEQNLELMDALEGLAALAPVLVGASRKSFLGRFSGPETLPPEERLEASLAAACRAAAAGAVCVRVHDVRATVRALDAWKAFG